MFSEELNKISTDKSNINDVKNKIKKIKKIL